MRKGVRLGVHVDRRRREVGEVLVGADEPHAVQPAVGAAQVDNAVVFPHVADVEAIRIGLCGEEVPRARCPFAAGDVEASVEGLIPAAHADAAAECPRHPHGSAIAPVEVWTDPRVVRDGRRAADLDGGAPPHHHARTAARRGRIPADGAALEVEDGVLHVDGAAVATRRRPLRAAHAVRDRAAGHREDGLRVGVLVLKPADAERRREAVGVGRGEVPDHAARFHREAGAGAEHECGRALFALHAVLQDGAVPERDVAAGLNLEHRDQQGLRVRVVPPSVEHDVLKVERRVRHTCKRCPLAVCRTRDGPGAVRVAPQGERPVV